ncbi:hypothetical protein CUC08_Gglean009576 [Alternaria sp. MG1]|nr:hypothetical protein CUC08_Gglean009576 [Alternaria sp. MG1]
MWILYRVHVHALQYISISWAILLTKHGRSLSGSLDLRERSDVGRQSSKVFFGLRYMRKRELRPKRQRTMGV